MGSTVLDIAALIVMRVGDFFQWATTGSAGFPRCEPVVDCRHGARTPNASGLRRVRPGCSWDGGPGLEYLHGLRG